MSKILQFCKNLKSITRFKIIYIYNINIIIYIYNINIYIYIIYIYIILIILIYIYNIKFQFKQTWRLTKAIPEMKCDTEQTMKLE